MADHTSAPVTKYVWRVFHGHEAVEVHATTQASALLIGAELLNRALSSVRVIRIGEW